MLSRRKNELIGARTAGQRVVGAGREKDILAGRAGQYHGTLSGLVENEMYRIGMAEAVGGGQRHHIGLRWIVTRIVGDAVIQRSVDGRERAVSRRRAQTTAGTAGRRTDRERVVRRGSVAVGDIQARYRRRAVAIVGDAERIGADDRPGGEDARCVRRAIGADEGDGQRLASRIAMTVTDLCNEFDLQYVAGIQEVEIGIDRLIGPVQDNRSAIAWCAVERHVRGIHQGR